jgi:transcription elongation factor Elf1
MVWLRRAMRRKMPDAMTTVPVRRFPTKIHVRCAACGHQGFAKVFLVKGWDRKLKCSKCGSRTAIVVTRDRTQAWSARRGAGSSKGETVH